MEGSASGTGKVVSAGKPEPANFKSPLDTTPAAAAAAAPAKTQAEIDAEALAATAGTTKTQAEIDAEALAASAATQPKVLSDEELQAEYEKRFPKKTELTAEQIKAAEQAEDKRMLDLYVDNGGTIEQYSLLKNFANADLTELSKTALAAELKENGITDPAQIEAIQKERYFQIEQAEIDEMEDEDAKALAQKKLDYGRKKFEEKGAAQKNTAIQFFNTLKDAIKEQDLQATQESQFSSNVEEHFNKVERKIALQLGQVNDTDITPVDYEVPDAAIAKAKEILKDPVARKQLLFTEDGSLNLQNIAELVLKGQMFDSAVKTAYLESGNRQVEEFQKVFPFVDPKSIGVGGAQKTSNTGTGKLVKAGQKQRFTPRQ